jgi:hypothetical protein
MSIANKICFIYKGVKSSQHFFHKQHIYHNKHGLPENQTKVYMKMWNTLENVDVFLSSDWHRELPSGG